jgi:hypothetical protein
VRTAFRATQGGKTKRPPCRPTAPSPRPDSVTLDPGTCYPVARTRAAWGRCVAVPPGVVCQDEAGRLWDVLFLLRCAIGRSDGGLEVRFGAHVRNGHRERPPRRSG